MDTTAVSTEEIIRKRRILKWRDYHLLKHLVRMAVSSPNLKYSQVSELGLRLSMFKQRNITSKSIYICCFFDEQLKKYKLHCSIK